MAIYGTNASETIDGTNFADISIFGYGGNDTINGYDGNDIIDAGTGNDNVFGGNGNDTILGRSGNDYLFGDNGNDAMWGEDGNDYLFGGDGNDTLLGGQGDDIYLINDFSDTVTEYANQGIDSVISYISGYTLTANVEKLTLAGTVYSGYGNNFNNTLTGNNSNNYLSGRDGSDTLDGKGGNDYLYGAMMAIASPAMRVMTHFQAVMVMTLYLAIPYLAVSQHPVVTTTSPAAMVTTWPMVAKAAIH